MPDLDWVDKYVTETFDRVERFRKRLLADLASGPIGPGTTIHVGGHPGGGKTEEQRRQSRTAYGEGGFNPSMTERRTGTSSLTPDIKAALVASRDAMMLGCRGNAARALALDQVNDVLRRSGFVWHQPMRHDGYGHVQPFGPAILVEPKS